MQAERTGKIGLYAVLLLILAAGCVFLLHAGMPVPCVFHLVTGLKCPGCGITHLLLALVQGRVTEAFWYNPAVFIVLPVLCVMVLVLAVRYVRTGSTKTTRTEDMIFTGMAAGLILFGIIRNIIHI